MINKGLNILNLDYLGKPFIQNKWKEENLKQTYIIEDENLNNFQNYIFSQKENQI